MRSFVTRHTPPFRKRCARTCTRDSRGGSSGTKAKRSSSATTSSRRTGIEPASARATTRSLCAPVELLGRAGSRASGRGDAAASLALLRRSLELLPDKPPAPRGAPARAQRRVLGRRRHRCRGGHADQLHRSGARRGRHAHGVVRTARARCTRCRCARRHGRARADGRVRRKGIHRARRRPRSGAGLAAARPRRAHGAAVRRVRPPPSSARSRTREHVAIGRSTRALRTGSAPRCSSDRPAFQKRSRAPR